MMDNKTLKNFTLISVICLGLSFQLNIIPLISNNKGGDGSHICPNSTPKILANTTLRARIDILIQDMVYGLNNNNNNYNPFSLFHNSNISSDPNFYCNKFGIIQQWNLVNEKAFMVPLSSTVYLIGVFFGCICCSLLSDKFGRKYVLGRNYVILTLFSIIPALVTVNYASYMLIRAVQGFSYGGISICSVVLLSETLPPAFRHYYLLFPILFYSISCFILAWLAYQHRHWQNLQLLTGLILMACLVPLKFIDESILWLNAHKTRRPFPGGGIDEGKDFISDKNSKSSTSDSNASENSDLIELEVDVKEKIAGKISTKISSILEWYYVKQTILAGIISFFTELIYTTMLYDSHILPGNQYLNFVLYGASDTFMCICGTIGLRYGRKLPITLSNIVIILTLITKFLIKDHSHSLDLALLLIMSVANGTVLYMILLYFSELYPTSIRNSGTGIASSCGRIGAIFSPFISHLNSKYPASFGLFMIMSLVIILCVWMLPSTKKSKYSDEFL